MTTDQRMIWATIGGMVSFLAAVVGGHLLGYDWWGVGVGVAIALSTNWLVRCPRCGSNVYRQESTGLGQTYSILNTSCYKCGLSFTKEYVASDGREAARWAPPTPWWRRAAFTGCQGKVVAGARAFLTIVALGIGYLNFRAVSDPGLTWSMLTLRAVLMGCAYLLLLVAVRKLVSMFESRGQ